MLKSSYKLAGAELKIMKMLWANNGTLSTGELLERMNKEGKTWKRQTLNTLLARLEEKGMVSRPRAFVEAKISETDLLQLQTKEILDRFYGGKLRNFCAALLGDVGVNAKEAESLDDLVDEIQKKQEG